MRIEHDKGGLIIYLFIYWQQLGWLIACLIGFWEWDFLVVLSCLSNCTERSCLERLTTVYLPQSLGCLVFLFLFIKLKGSTYVDWKQKSSDFEEFKSVRILQIFNSQLDVTHLRSEMAKCSFFSIILLIVRQLSCVEMKE